MSSISLPIRINPVSRARRRTALGLVLSVLVHVLLFMLLRAKLNEMPPPQVKPEGQPEAPLQVTFIQPHPVPEPPRPQPQPPAKAPTPPRKAAAKPTPKPAARPTSRPTQVARAEPVTPSPTAITTPAQPAPEMDFSSMLNRNRERRQAAEESAAQENAAARAAENPSANDIAKANIAFQQRRGQVGQNGVFEVVSKGPRMAQYVFRGWTTDQRNSRKQYIDVDAGPGGNVELAIVNSMIALIRKYYSGDFNWDSARLGRVVPLSARQEDTRGLQDFLLKEFFSVH